MTRQVIREPHHSTSYEIFILVLTLLSLGVMALLLLPLNQATIDLLTFYDNLICFVFLFDFAAQPRRHAAPARVLHPRAAAGSTCSDRSRASGCSEYAALLRLARLSRLARIARLLRGQKRKELVADILQNRGPVRGVHHDPGGHDRPGDLEHARAPVRGRVTGCEHHDRRRRPLVVGGDDHHRRLWRQVPRDAAGPHVRRVRHVRRCRHHRALASILASLLVPDSDDTKKPSEDGAAAAAGSESAPAVAAELASIREELASLRRSLAPQAAAQKPIAEAGDSAPMGPTVPADAALYRRVRRLSRGHGARTWRPPSAARRRPRRAGRRRVRRRSDAIPGRRRVPRGVTGQAAR